jgi:hypothetical protein
VNAILSFHYLIHVVSGGWTPPPDTIYVINHRLFETEPTPWYGEHFRADLYKQENVEKVRVLLAQAREEGRLYCATSELYGSRLYSSVLKKFGLKLRDQSKSGYTWSWFQKHIEAMTDGGWVVFDGGALNQYHLRE